MRRKILVVSILAIVLFIAAAFSRPVKSDMPVPEVNKSVLMKINR